MIRDFLQKTISDLVAIPSPSGQEEAASDYVFRHLEEAGLSPQRDEDANVWVEVGSGKGLLHVNGHLDTVVPVDGWKTDPLKAHLDGDNLHGLGATDCKGGLASMLYLAPRVKPNVRTIFSWTVCEEGTGHDKANGARRMSEMGGDWVLITEPTTTLDGPNLSLGTQGHARGTANFPGKAAHSSRPDLGENAIYKAARFCLEIDKLNEEFKTVQVYQQVFARPSIAATMISGGKLSNIIPDACEVIVSRRLAPGEKLEDFQVELEKLLAGTGATFDAASDGPCAMVDLEGQLFATARKAVVDLLGEERLSWQRGRNDAILFTAKGLDTLTIGPGLIGQPHTANEYINLPTAVDSTRLLEKTINELPDKA